MKEYNLFNYYQSPFDGVRIYLSGKFSCPKEIIADKLESLGAIVRTIGPVSATNYLGLSKETCVIIAANKLSEQENLKIDTLKHDGFHIPIISEKELNEILTGNKQVSFPTPVKNVNITFDFIFNSRTPMIQHFNFYEFYHPLGQKEIYFQDLKGEKDLLLQSLGNIGAFSNFEFDPKTIDFCWLKTDTIELLKQGIKDKFIETITNKYNSSDANKFTYKFIVESEAIYWMLYRAKACGDELSYDYLTRYLNSIYPMNNSNI